MIHLPDAEPCSRCGEPVFVVFDPAGEEVGVETNPSRGAGMKIEYSLGSWYGTRVLPSPSGACAAHAIHLKHCSGVSDADRARLLAGPKLRTSWKLDATRRRNVRVSPSSSSASEPGPERRPPAPLEAVCRASTPEAPNKRLRQLCFFFAEARQSSTVAAGGRRIQPATLNAISR